MEETSWGWGWGWLENKVWVKIAFQMCHHTSDSKKEKKKKHTKKKDKASGASSPGLVLSHIWLSCSLRWHEKPQLSYLPPLFLPSLFTLGELIHWPRYQWLVVMVLIKEEIATL